ncbi:malto-oligosyltrehalose trehalohydrolase TreZ [Thermacetogenium phaeum DSM 12270]|uniref:Malto-oligosyltrehalose trehalohydrolase n=1 Tax=Thermacetogenium phaeum (strain ATCC BAA-254 / DSM 26808 / PB) TaxID=1089553 RepID=K4LY02_THEPS|nr:malto-oligosyltrehalose trehalohydrolase [Thermacetogenium phaeum]AFV12814.1 malto-oligosyltrehalose trehalohydrolase TreZ [Thermacetogenium phaeum DSM 12270]
MLKMGASIINGGVSFRVFAYNRKRVALVVHRNGREEVFPMTEEEPHLYSTVLEGAGPGLLYKFRLDDEGDFPDPYSHYQPEGVHGFSQVIDHNSYRWQDENWRGRNLEELVIMEIHVGTFSQEGTFKGVLERLDYLRELGVNAIELMPVVQTPGRWNWGYDGANLFSVNNNYGTPDDLKQLIDSCHREQIAVILDVVYNHFGPEGNYIPVYGPYLTDKYQTPWGPAVNYDDRYSRYTRKMVLDNIRYWLEDYHIDGLRLDAVHAIKDSSPIHILQEIALTVRNLSLKQNRRKFVIAESDANDSRLINPLDRGGYGMDAQWMDDFHHCIHTVLTGEHQGYYIDYGWPEYLEKVFKNYLYTGQYSRYWGKKRGTDGSRNPGRQFVVAIQNHDQVGNRGWGERLAALVDFPYLKAAAGLLFFAPYVPLIFMGEEYGEKNPFLFFTDYQDPELKRNISLGRKEEFKKFGWQEIPDPQDPATFYRSRLTPRRLWREENRRLFRYYRDLIALRLSHPVLKEPDKRNLEIKVDGVSRLVVIARWREGVRLTGLFNLGERVIPIEGFQGREIFNSEWRAYGGEDDGESRSLKKGQVAILEN